MKILFLTPPFLSNIDYPLLGAPALVSFLRKKGYDVTQADINVNYIYQLLERNLFTIVLKNIKEMFNELNSKDVLNYFEQKDLLTLEKFTSRGIYLSKCAKVKYQKIRKGEKVPDWTEIISSVTRITYTETFGTSIGLLEKIIKRNIKEIADIILSRSNSVFYKFINSYIQNEVKIINPDVVGISLLSCDQLGASLLIAYLLKSNFPGVKVYFGGSYINSIHTTISKDENLYDFVDGIFIGEGEYPFLTVIKKLETNDSSVNIPNYINKENTNPAEIFYGDINKYPEPDFDDLDLTKYAKAGAISLYTSKGCAWGKCAFCAVSEAGSYREKEISTVINEIQKLYLKYNLRQISFVDDFLSTSRMELIAKYIIDNKLNIRWDCRTRFSENMTEEFLNLLKMSHNTCITLGMESASERLLRFINKGITKQTVDFVLNNSEKSNQYVSLDMMIGLPSETQIETIETLAASYTLRKKYPNLRFQVNTQRTRIERNSSFAFEPEKYGINLLGRNELSTTIEWIMPEWTDEYMTRQRKHLYPENKRVVPNNRNYKLNYYLLELKPEKKALIHLITSNYNLSALSNNISATENEIRAHTIENKYLFWFAAGDFADKYFVRSEGEQNCYITINKFNFKIPGRRFKVSPLVKCVFELCDGYNTLNEIFQKTIKRFQTNNTPLERMQKNIMSSLNQLYSIGAINIRLNQKSKIGKRVSV